MTKLEKPLAVQILQATNVGVARRDQEEGGRAGDDQGMSGDVVEEEKFETKYLDPSLAREKKKYNKDSSRMMKLSLTDGLNQMEAIEYERFQKMEYFNIGQKLMLTPPIEIRRGVLFLTNSNVSYLGQPLTSTPAGIEVAKPPTAGASSQGAGPSKQPIGSTTQ